MTQMTRQSGEGKRLPEWAVKLMIWCLPVLALLLIAGLGFGRTLTRASIPTFLALAAAGLIITRLIFLARSRRKGKATLIAFWLAMLIAVAGISFFLPHTSLRCERTQARERFMADVSEDAPALPEIGNADSAVYCSYTWDAFMFNSRTGVLLYSCSEAEYESAMALLAERCSFRTEPMPTGRYDERRTELTTEPYAEIGGDCFRVLLPEAGGVGDLFYKSCLLVMNNDAAHQIAYVVFSDVDLDVAASLKELLEGIGRWNTIRAALPV